MTIRRRHAVIAFGSAILLSLLQLTSALNSTELSVYDTYLHLRPNKEQSNRLLLLDVDDTAVDRVGEWPWPRSVMAQGLLRLKEFGADAVVFDIEYVNQSPKGIDTLYFGQGLRQDFQRSFGDIASNVSDLLGALSSGQIGNDDASYYADALGDLIADERDGLLAKTETLVRDNDNFLSQAAALYGRAWGTVHLQKDRLNDSEQEQKLRRELASKKFGYPVSGNGSWASGDYGDILAPIPSFLSSVRGGGFTNVHIDEEDGTRRRIALAQNVDGTWYLQLIFAPLMEAMGNPKLEFAGRSLVVSDATMEDGSKRSFSIPLDRKGRMLIDWPKGTYWDENSYKHFSFAHLAALEEEELVLDQIVLTLGSMDVWTVLDSSSQLSPERKLLMDSANAIDESQKAQALALSDTDESAYAAHL
ncbi:MAG TPA: CHASE2 domain-containing protein, partial [Spirochaetales bacterium]|nr:CHASE2 domain-containing protein [Spirochaetales bacterium]